MRYDFWHCGREPTYRTAELAYRIGFNPMAFAVNNSAVSQL